MGEIGEKPCNPIQMKCEVAQEGIPVNGLIAQLSKKAQVQVLLDAIGVRLEVPREKLMLVYEGRTLEADKIISDNGIPEPGAMAKKKGEKIHLTLFLADGVVPGYVAKTKQKTADQAAAGALADADARAEAELVEQRELADQEFASDARYQAGGTLHKHDPAWDPAMRGRFDELRLVLILPVKKQELKPVQLEAPKNDDDIRELLMRLVPGSDKFTAPNYENKLVLDIIVAATHTGFPTLAAESSAYFSGLLKQGLAEAIDAGDADGIVTLDARVKAARRLLAGFEACGDVQARASQTFTQEIRGELSVELQIKRFVKDRLKRTLADVVTILHPDLKKSTGSELQDAILCHLESYGLTDADDAKIDGSKIVPLPQKDMLKVYAFMKSFIDINRLIDDIMDDVNMSSEAVAKMEEDGDSRKIDTALLSKFAGDNYEEFGQDIFYDADREMANYKGEKPSDDDAYKPFVYREFVLKLLHKVLVQP